MPPASTVMSRSSRHALSTGTRMGIGASGDPVASGGRSSTSISSSVSSPGSLSGPLMRDRLQVPRERQTGAQDVDGHRNRAEARNGHGFRRDSADLTKKRALRSRNLNAPLHITLRSKRIFLHVDLERLHRACLADVLVAHVLDRQRAPLVELVEVALDDAREVRGATDHHVTMIGRENQLILEAKLSPHALGEGSELSDDGVSDLLELGILRGFVVAARGLGGTVFESHFLLSFSLLVSRVRVSGRSPGEGCSFGSSLASSSS